MREGERVMSSDVRNVKKGEETTALAAIGTKAPVALHTFSSQFSSAASTLVFFPFDLLRTRFMSQDGSVHRQHNGQTYSSIMESFRTIYRVEGFRKLFKGCGVAVGGSFVVWGMYMSIYRELCNMTEMTGLLGRGALSIVASAISTVVCSPIFLIKSRMQIEEANKSTDYKNFFSSVRHVVKTGGVRSLWRGVSLQLVLIIPYAFNFPLYDTLKRNYLQYLWSLDHKERDLNLAEVCICSAVTKIALLTVSHPIIVLKVRIQDQRAHLGSTARGAIRQTFVSALKTSGVKGLYRGYVTALVHTLPRSVLQYVIYEKTLNLLCNSYRYQR